MSANNFWNSFKNGFTFGMLANTPMFNCFNNFSGFGNWFGGMSVFGGFNNCCFNNFFDKTSLFMVPNAFTSSFYQVMPDATPPSMNFNFDTSKMFDNSHIWDNFQNTNWQMPAISDNSFNMNFSNFDWGDSFQGNWAVKTQSSDSQNVKITYDAAELKKTWSKKKKDLSDAFYNKVIEVAKNLKCSPNDLMAVMYSESGLDSKKLGKNGATGLIQFLPRYHASLGTSKDALLRMSNVEQMNYVEKCIQANKKCAGIKADKTIDSGTLYALVYLPSRANQEVLAKKDNDSKGYYAQNKGLDKNKDGKITKSELATRLQSYYA